MPTARLRFRGSAAETGSIPSWIVTHHEGSFPEPLAPGTECIAAPHPEQLLIACAQVLRSPDPIKACLARLFLRAINRPFLPRADGVVLEVRPVTLDSQLAIHRSPGQPLQSRREVVVQSWRHPYA